MGFHLISPLNSPISSSSVHGSFRTAASTSAEGERECVSGTAGDLALSGVAAGDVVVEMRDFFFGGIVVD